jgi:glycerol-3-phosphate dehydrogenase
MVIDHSSQGGPGGMHSLVGGKLSTFRPLAREVANIVGPGSMRTDGEAEAAPGWRETLKASALPLAAKQHLRVYGAGIAEVLALGEDILCEHAPATEGEVRYVLRMEQAQTLADVMMRRTGVSWAACRGLCCAERVAEIAGVELGWKAAERKRQLNAFREELDFHLPTVEAL